MTRVGIRELKDHASRIVREVRDSQEQVVVTHQGQPVAVLSPYTERDAERERQEERRTSLRTMKELAQDVAHSWTSKKSAVEILTEQRR